MGKTAHTAFDCAEGCSVEATLAVIGGKWKGTIDLFPNQAKAYVFWNLYPCPHPGPPPRGREPFCGRFK